MKNFIVLFLLVSALGISACTTNAQLNQAKENNHVPEELLRDIKINKLFMCHYLFAVAEQRAKGEKKEKLIQIALSLKLQATKLATIAGGPEYVEKALRDSQVGFRKFMNRLSEIESVSERNKALKKYSVSCAATAGA